MSYEYCRDVTEDIADLRRELFGQNVEIITDHSDNDDETGDELSQSYDEYENDEGLSLIKKKVSMLAPKRAP